MALDAQEIGNQLKAGTLTLAELEKEFSTAASGLVTVQDWQICYSSATGQLSEFCVVTSNNSSNPITGIGMLAYSSNGATMWALQYDNGFSTTDLAVSIGTGLYTPSMGNQALCVVYGWTAQGSFYFPQTMNIGSC